MSPDKEPTVYRIGYSCRCEQIGVDHRRNKEADVCPSHKAPLVWATALSVEDDRKMFGKQRTERNNGEPEETGGQKAN